MKVILGLAAIAVAAVVGVLLASGGGETEKPSRPQATPAAPSSQAYVPPRRRVKQDGRTQEKMKPAEIVEAATETPEVTSTSSPVVAKNSPLASNYPGLLRPCKEARGFTIYGGQVLSGLPAKRSIAICNAPPQVIDGRLAPPNRVNFALLTYGPCRQAGEGCSSDLSIYNAPSCEQPHNLYHVVSGPPGQGPAKHDHITINGVPAASFDDGSRLELYTKYTTVTVVATTAAMASQAARGLRAVPSSFKAAENDGAKFSKPATDVSKSGPGRVLCPE